MKITFRDFLNLKLNIIKLLYNVWLLFLCREGEERSIKGNLWSSHLLGRFCIVANEKMMHEIVHLEAWTAFSSSELRHYLGL